MIMVNFLSLKCIIESLLDNRNENNNKQLKFQKK